MKTKIKHIIFDVGNVLFKYDPEHIIESLLPKTPHKELYLNELFYAECWQKLDRGDLTLVTLLKHLTETLNLNTQQQSDISHLVTSFTKHLIVNTDMQRLFESLCSSYTVFILSNFQSAPFKQLQADHPFLSKATGSVISVTAIRSCKAATSAALWFSWPRRPSTNRQMCRTFCVAFTAIRVPPSLSRKTAMTARTAIRKHTG